MEEWKKIHAESIDNSDLFWLDITRKDIAWEEKPTIGLEGGFDNIADEMFKWFSNGRLNATISCLDQHLANRGDKVAILWEGDEPTDVRKISYRELHAQVCQFSNALESQGVGLGDRVIIYMGMIPEAAVAMLACARIGAIHSVVFGGFSAESLSDRIVDSGSKVIITMDEGKRGGRTIPLKATTDEAIAKVGGIDTVIVYEHTSGKIDWFDDRDCWWSDAIESQELVHDAQIVDAEHPLFILYTSGSTGKPKGQVHSHGGYITYTSFTHKTVFDLR